LILLLNTSISEAKQHPARIRHGGKNHRKKHTLNCGDSNNCNTSTNSSTNITTNITNTNTSTLVATMSSNKEFEGDAGAPLPDFSGARNISLTTVAPALGVRQQGQAQPDYLDFDQKGRGMVVTMFANAGTCYLMGIGAGGMYGLRKGIATTPSSKFKVQVNSVLNNAGRYGSRAGNTLGVVAVLYSLYEGLGDNLELDQYTGIESSSPPLAAMLTGVSYFAPAGLRVAALGGALGMGAVGATFAGYAALGKPVGSYGLMWF